MALAAVAHYQSGCPQAQICPFFPRIQAATKPIYYSKLTAHDQSRATLPPFA